MKSPLFSALIVPVLVCLLTFKCIAQYPHKVNHAIYFVNYKTLKVKSIKHKSHIGYILSSDSTYNKGVVKKISYDTIFVNNAWFRVNNLILIVNPNFIGPEDIDEVISWRHGIIYRNDTANWNYLCPSKRAYTSRFRLSEEIKEFRIDAKKEKRMKNYDPIQNNYLQFNLTRAIYLDLGVSYERKLSKYISLGIETGYKFAPGNDYGGGIYPLVQSGPSLIIGPKFYSLSKFYFSPLLHLRYFEIHNAYYKDIFTGDYSTLMDQFRTLAGISLRMGKMICIGQNVWLDFYFGAGIKLAYSHQISYLYYYQDEPMYFNYERTPVVSNKLDWLPLFSIGVKIGIGF
jgi:hypothetical protein